MLAQAPRLGMLGDSGCFDTPEPRDAPQKLQKKPRERWTDEEHRLFVEGLKKFHRDWRAIERARNTHLYCVSRSLGLLYACSRWLLCSLQRV